MNINLDFSVQDSKRHQAAQYAEEMRDKPLTSSSANTSALQQHLKEVHGISSEEFQTAIVEGKVTREELLDQGIDPSSASTDQINEAIIRIKMGKNLGLTPTQIEQAMQTSSMTPQQFKKTIENSSNSGSVDGISTRAQTTGSTNANLGGGEISTNSQIVLLGPPHPKMSAASFFGAITKALETIMLIKGETSIQDAQMTKRLLDDVSIQTRQKISFSEQQTAAMVESLRQALHAMLVMRIILYVTMAVMFIITVIITIVTAGAGTAAMIAAMIAIAAALAAMIFVIVANEMRRRGKLQGNDAAMEAIYWTLVAIQIIASFGVAVAVAAAVSKVLAEAVKQGLELTIKLVLKLVGNLISQLIGQLVQALSSIFQLRGILGRDQYEADKASEQEYNSSSQKSDVEAKRNSAIAQVQSDYASGKITSTQRDRRINAINQRAEVEHASNFSVIRKANREAYQKNEETMGWIVMGVSIALSLMAAASAAMQQSLQTLLKEVSEELLGYAEEFLKSTVGKILNLVLSLLQAVIQLAQAGVQGFIQVETEEIQIKILERSLDARQMVIIMDSLSTMWENLQEDMQKLMEGSMKSINNLIKALSAAFDSGAKAMEMMTQKI